MNRFQFTVSTALIAIGICSVVLAVLNARYDSQPFNRNREVAKSIMIKGCEARFSLVETGQYLQNTPSWSEYSASPPLNNRAALKIAENLLTDLLEASSEFDWGFQSLELFSLDQREPKWCYRVNFSGLCIDAHSGPPCTYSALIFMDGTIVVPKSTEEGSLDAKMYDLYRTDKRQDPKEE